MEEIPPDKPSKPSIRLMILTHAIIKNIVIGYAQIPKDISGKPKTVILSNKIPP